MKTKNASTQQFTISSQLYCYTVLYDRLIHDITVSKVRPLGLLETVTGSG